MGETFTNMFMFRLLIGGSLLFWYQNNITKTRNRKISGR